MSTSNPYHVRLAISQYGDQFRAELFTEDLGDTEGDLLPARWKDLDEWGSYLTQGAGSLPADAASKVGKKLFNYLLGHAENSKKWMEILAHAERQGRPIRLLIDATTDKVRDLPYGLLCEPNDSYYLMRKDGSENRPQIHYVRIVRRCTPKTLDLSKRPLRLLIAAAEPTSRDIPGFDCAERLYELTKGVTEAYEVFVCLSEGVKLLQEVLPKSVGEWQPKLFEPFCRTTRKILQTALTNKGEYDILHLVAHGVGTGVLLYDPNRGWDEVISDELGEWCSASQLQMAFLQACKASQTAERGGFGGVAQQLLNPKYGDLAAVVASPYPVDAKKSTPAAISFYQSLFEGKSPDLALNRSLPLENWSWAFLELWVRPRALGDPGTRGAFQFASPYRGLARFEERDAEIFRGRKAETVELLNILKTESVVALVGDSGSGKSSLLHAGVIHTVRQQGLLDRTDWRIVSLKPGMKPAQSLLIALKDGTNNSLPLVGGRSGRGAQESPKGWRETLRTAFEHKLHMDSPFLLIFDQFEELFTLCEDDEQRRAVGEVLKEVTQQYPDRIHLILGMRSEYLGAAAALPGLTMLIKRPWVLKPPDADDVRKIVVEPAEYYGYTFQDGLLERILNDPLLTSGSSDHQESSPSSSTTSAPLPLLEFALERLWLKAVKRGSHKFTLEDYESLGGLGGAITHHADEVYDHLPQHPELGLTAQRLTEQIFTGLVSTKGTQHPRSRLHLEEETGVPELTHKVIDWLVGERLLTVRRDPNNPNDSQVDLAHEVLIERWDQLKGWLAEDPEGRELKERFQQDMERWEEGLSEIPPHSLQLLPNPDVASGYLKWIERNRPSLTEAQQAFAEELRNLLRRIEEEQEVQRQKEEEQRQQELESARKTAEAEEKARREAEKRREAEEQARHRAEQAHREAEKRREAEEQARHRAEQARREAEKRREAEEQARHRAEQARRETEKRREAEEQARHEAEEREKDQKRAAAGYLKLSIGLIVLFLVAVGTAIFAWQQQQKAQQETIRAEVERTHAEEQKNIALRTQSLFLADLAQQESERENYSNAILLALEALPNEKQPERPYVPEAEFQLYHAVTHLREQRVLSGHGEDIVSAAFSPDGTRIVTASISTTSMDGTTRVWDAATGQEVTTLSGHENYVNSTAFSPDGTRVVTASRDGTARVWDAATGQVLATLSESMYQVNSAAFSPDGMCIVTGSADGTVRVWDAATSQVMMTTRQYFYWRPGTWAKSSSFHTINSVYSAAFSPDGTRIIARLENDSVRVLDATTGAEVATLSERTDGVRLAAFSPDGTRIITASGDGQVRVWFSGSGQLQVTLSGHTAAVYSAAFSPDGARIVTASKDSTARVWFPDSGRVRVTLSGHTDDVYSAAFSPDGTRIVTASADNTARVWDTVTGQEVAILSGHTDDVYSAAFSPDGTRIVTASMDGTARVWHATTDQVPLIGHKADVNSAEFSPDGTRIVTASKDDTARVWDAATGQLLVTLSGHEWYLNSATFSPDGTRIVTASRDSTARIWDTATGQEKVTLIGHEESVYSAAFSPDGTRIVTASADHTARVWDAISGQEVAALSGHEWYVRSAAFSPDGTRIITASGDHAGISDETVRVWDAATGQILVTLSGHERYLNSAAFSPDGTRIVTASADHTARVWDTATGQEVAILSGHTDAVYSAAFSPDGTRIVTASEDETARVWKTVTGQEVATLAGHTGYVRSAAFSPDGTRIVTASGDETARVWDTVTGQEVATLTGHKLYVRSAVFSPDGTRIVTVSGDKTPRVWHALSTQELIGYANSIVPRRLTKEERKQYFLE